MRYARAYKIEAPSEQGLARALLIPRTRLSEGELIGRHVWE